jgi:SAM-dependent methyltransferase
MISNSLFTAAGLKSESKRFSPAPLWTALRTIRTAARHLEYRAYGRPANPGETAKARDRRVREGFFDRYCRGRGLDIGYGGDLLCANCIGWDLEHGDAQFLARVENASFDFVYSSHTLEHVADEAIALRNWYRVVKPGGYLILFVPDRELYEKKITLPSRWNPEHKRFFLIDRDEAPDIVGVLPLISRSIPEAIVISATRCDAGHTIEDPWIHSDGEYSIEVIVRKKVGAAKPSC